MDYIDSKQDRIKLDKGLFFGKGLFETILVKEKAVFLEEHINRLNKSIDIMGLGEHIDIKFIKNFIKEEKLKNIVLKIVVTEKNIVFSTRRIKYSKEDYKNGFNLKLYISPIPPCEAGVFTNILQVSILFSNSFNFSCSFIVSIYTFPQIIPLDTLISLNISGVIELKKYQNTTLLLATSRRLFVKTTAAVVIMLNGLSFF